MQKINKNWLYARSSFDIKATIVSYPRVLLFKPSTMESLAQFLIVVSVTMCKQSVFGHYGLDYPPESNEPNNELQDPQNERFFYNNKPDEEFYRELKFRVVGWEQSVLNLTWSLWIVKHVIFFQILYCAVKIRLSTMIITCSTITTSWPIGISITINRRWCTATDSPRVTTPGVPNLCSNRISNEETTTSSSLNGSLTTQEIIYSRRLRILIELVNILRLHSINWL